MKNLKKKLSFLLAAVPMLSNVGTVSASASMPAANQDIGLIPSQENKSKKNKDNGGSEKSEAARSIPENLNKYLPKSLSRAEKDIRAVIASDIMERISNIRNTSLELITDMTEENFGGISGAEYTDMLSSMEKVQAETDVLATSMKDVNNKLNNSTREEIDNLIRDLEIKVNGFEDLVNDTKKRSWPELKKNMIDYSEQIVHTNALKKKALVKTCKAQCQRTRQLINNLENSLQTAIATDPTMEALYAHIQESAKEVVTSLNRLDSQLVNVQSLAIQSLQSMKETAQLWETRASKLIEEFGKIQTKASSDSYANVLTDLETKVVKTEMNCENRTQMNIARRIMTDSQRTSLMQVKEELKKLFDNVKKEIQNVRNDATSSKSLSKAMPNSIRQKLEDLVNETLGETADHMRSWNRTIVAIEKDDELRSQWNPEEMLRIMKQRMTDRCYEILTNNAWNISKKTKAIVAEINNVQPGTGTMVEPVVKGIIEYLMKGTPLTSLGETVEGSLNDRSWIFSGEGGTGKSTAAELLAAAFNARLFKINGSQLRNSVEMERIYKELRSLTQPRASAKDGVVNFMVLIDEVDTGVCVATDAAGRSIELEDSNDVRDEQSDVDDLDRTLDRTNNKKWKLKKSTTRNTAVGARRENGSSKSKQTLSFKRHQQAFSALSRLNEMLERNPLCNMFGKFSTTNAYRASMPEEIARRLCPPSKEIAFRKPTKQEFVAIINKKMPNLSFSDGYDKIEGAAKIAEQAEKYGLSAAGLLSAITPIANAVRKPEESSCTLPATGICKLISGSITESGLIEEARQLNYEEIKSKRGANLSDSDNDDSTTYDEENSKPYEEGLGAFAPGVRLTPPNK